MLHFEGEKKKVYSIKSVFMSTQNMFLPTCPARSMMGISSGAILQFSLVTRVTAAPERLKRNMHQHHKLAQAQPGSKVCMHTLLPCSASATYTMNIFLDVTWEVKVEDVCYVMDIQPSRCQICGHEDTNSTWKKIQHLFCHNFDPTAIICGSL